MYKNNNILFSAMNVIVLILCFFSTNVTAAYIADSSGKKCKFINIKNSLDLKNYKIKVCYVEKVVFGDKRQNFKNAAAYWTFTPPLDDLGRRVRFSANVKFRSYGEGELHVAAPRDVRYQHFERYQEEKIYKLNFYVEKYLSPKSFLVTLIVQDVMAEPKSGYVEIYFGGEIKSELTIYFKSIINIRSINSYCLIKTDRRFGGMIFQDRRGFNFKHAKFTVRGHASDTNPLALRFIHTSENKLLENNFVGYESKKLARNSSNIVRADNGVVELVFENGIYFNDITIAPYYLVPYQKLNSGIYKSKTRIICD
ncbi:hypothetical protein [Vibrio harveyi]|uniref:hypothetical protein n=1 Tax=Vibrio harveyi TaxID=669 RepID=UPI002ADF37B6|nr:hypothetical protein [Vibrio harveyi]